MVVSGERTTAISNAGCMSVFGIGFGNTKTGQKVFAQVFHSKKVARENKQGEGEGVYLHITRNPTIFLDFDIQESSFCIYRA